MNGGFPNYLIVTGYLPVLLAFREELGCLDNASLLDFGCGGGKADRFFQLYFPSDGILGVDVSPKMIEAAKSNDPQGNYSLIDSDGKIQTNDQFKCAMANWVLVALDSLDRMAGALKEVHKVLKPDGVFVALVNNEDAVGIKNPVWVNGEADKKYNSSDKIIVSLFNETGKIQVQLNDYFWTEDDYCSAFIKAGFREVKSFVPDYNCQEAQKEIKYLNSKGFLLDINYYIPECEKPTRIVIGRK